MSESADEMRKEGEKGKTKEEKISKTYDKLPDDIKWNLERINNASKRGLKYIYLYNLKPETVKFLEGEKYKLKSEFDRFGHYGTSYTSYFVTW